MNLKVPAVVFTVVAAVVPLAAQSELERKVDALAAAQATLLGELEQIRKEIAELRVLLTPPGQRTAAVPSAPQPLAGAWRKGSPTAQTVLIEYSDFQCPFCGVFVRDTLPTLEDTYVAGGRVQIAFRHLPLSIHPHAADAAIAAECAGRQGKFWMMHDALFADQKRLDVQSLTAKARELGVEPRAFEECRRGVGPVKVADDARHARSLQISSTPTFLVGKLQSDETVQVVRRVSGAQPVDVFRKALGGVVSN